MFGLPNRGKKGNLVGPTQAPQKKGVPAIVGPKTNNANNKKLRPHARERDLPAPRVPRAREGHRNQDLRGYEVANALETIDAREQHLSTR